MLFLIKINTDTTHLCCLLTFIKCIISFQLFLDLAFLFIQSKQNQWEKRGHDKNAMFFKNSICLPHYSIARDKNIFHFNKIYMKKCISTGRTYRTSQTAPKYQYYTKTCIFFCSGDENMQILMGKNLTGKN